MNLNLPNEQQAFIEGLVAAGRYPTIEDAVSEGIRLLASHEHLKQQVEIGVEQADRGDVLDHDSVFGHLRRVAQAAESESRQ